MDTIDRKRPLTFILRGDANLCATGSWSQLSIGLLQHGTRGHTPMSLWVIGMAVCDKDMQQQYGPETCGYLADFLLDFWGGLVLICAS